MVLFLFRVVYEFVVLFRLFSFLESVDRNWVWSIIIFGLEVVWGSCLSWLCKNGMW